MTSIAKVTAPSMSAGVSPASATAAATASPASCSSLRPECFENSVWPMPDDGGVACQCAHAGVTGRNCGSTTSSTVSMLSATSMPFSHVVGLDTEEVGDEADAFVELDEDDDPRFRIGLGRMVRHDPGVDVTVAVDSWVSHSTEWHSPHIGAGG